MNIRALRMINSHEMRLPLLGWMCCMLRLAPDAPLEGVVDVQSPAQMRFSTSHAGPDHKFYRFHTPEGAPLGHLSIDTTTGSIAIGGMRDNENASLRSRKEVLAFAMKRLSERGCRYVWESNAFDCYYEGLWEFKYKRPLFKGAAYDGYIMEIPRNIDALLLGD